MLGNKEIMAQNIDRLMQERRLTRNDVCDALGIKYTTFTEWVKGTAYPRIDKIELMARYFGVQKKDLVEEYKPPTQEDRLITLLSSLTATERAEVENYINFIISRRNGGKTNG